MRKIVCPLIVSSVLAPAALTASGQGAGAKTDAQGRAAAPALGRAAARRLPGARLVEIAEAGHIPQVEAPAKYFRDLLDLLAAG